MLLVLRDIDEGYVHLGSGTTRGNGWVRAEVRGLTIETRAGKTPAGRLAGVGALAEELADYSLFSEDETALPQGLEARRKLVWDQLEIPGPRVDDLAEALVAGPWLKFLDQTRGKQWAA